MENEFDVLAIVETWLNDEGDDSTIQQMLPEGYMCKHIPRVNEGRAGGIAVVYKNSVQISLLDSSKSRRYKQFEHMDCLVKSKTHKLRLITMYRPPPNKKNGLKLTRFWKNWNKLLETFSASKCEVLLVGDLNFHLDVERKADTKLLNSSLAEFGLTQVVDEPTHIQTHTLDVMILREQSELIKAFSVTDPSLCNNHGKKTNDHFALIATINLHKFEIPKKVIHFRNMKGLDIDLFREKLQSTNLLNEEYIKKLPVDCLTSLYNDTLKTILDELAPMETKIIYPDRNDPWFTSEILAAKRSKRRAERLWRKTKSTEDHNAYKKLCIAQHKKASTSHRLHISKEIENCGSDQKQLFKVTNKLMRRNLGKKMLPSAESDQELANQFSAFFKDKIVNIRKELKIDQPLKNYEDIPNKYSQLLNFSDVGHKEVEDMVLQSGNKSCILDPIPTSVVKQLAPLLCSPITEIIKKSLIHGHVPEALKTAIIRPLIKDYSLDQNQLSSYRPVSNLPFIAKIMEKVVSTRIDEYLSLNNLHDIDQTAYKKFNSTETALTAIQNDILINMDQGKATVLVMLDMSAAYDTVDHGIFLQRLSRYFGFSGAVLKWFTSYVKGRKVKVMIGDKVSIERELDCGTAQGAVLGGKCYNLYTVPLRDIVKTSREIKRKGYADDNNTMIAFEIASEADKAAVLDHLTDYLDKFSSWMKCNMLKFNEDKTEIIIFSPKQHVNRFRDFSMTLGKYLIKCSVSVKNLGVHLDNSLTMEKHINAKTKSAHNQIRNIWTLRKYLTENAAKSLVNTLVIPKIDYCNSLLFGVKQSLRMKFQRVQNASARLIKKSKKRQHITPHLRELHWLPVKYRIEFKILLMVFKSLNGKSPQYINCLISDLRSTRFDNLKLTIPPFRLLRTGGRAFCVSAPTLWNQLPLVVRKSDTVSSFKKNLKTFYYKKHFGDS